MTRPNKFGLTAIILLLISAAPPYTSWRQPINAALITLAFIIGYKAARINPWWWSLCALIVAGIVFFLWDALRTF